MCKMDRNEKRAVIKYLNVKCLSAAEISGELNSVLETMHRRMLQFICGLRSFSVVESWLKTGHPVGVCTDENVLHVNDMITTDQRLTVRYVAACLKLSYGTIQPIMLYPVRWVSTRCVLDGCRECWRRIKSKSVWWLHVTISVCKTQIQRSFSADMSPWTRLGLTTSIPRPSSRASSGSMSLRRRQ